MRAEGGSNSQHKGIDSQQLWFYLHYGIRRDRPRKVASGRKISPKSTVSHSKAKSVSMRQHLLGFCIRDMCLLINTQ